MFYWFFPYLWFVKVCENNWCKYSLMLSTSPLLQRTNCSSMCALWYDKLHIMLYLKRRYFQNKKYIMVDIVLSLLFKNDIIINGIGTAICRNSSRRRIQSMHSEQMGRREMNVYLRASDACVMWLLTQPVSLHNVVFYVKSWGGSRALTRSLTVTAWRHRSETAHMHL